MRFGFGCLVLVGFLEGGVVLLDVVFIWVVEVFGVFFKLGKDHISKDRGLDNMPLVVVNDLCILSWQKKD